MTAELVPGLVLRNLGEHRLRDLGSPMLIWQLGTDEFPPLRTLDELPGNLPVQRTSFVGRVDEVKELAALVAIGAVGDTDRPGWGRASHAWRCRSRPRSRPVFRRRGVVRVARALEEGALVAATILEALGVPERRGEPALDTLCGWARSRDALVVIDNCEHLARGSRRNVDRGIGGVDDGGGAGDESGAARRAR